MDATGRYIYGVICGGAAESFPLEGVVQFEADLAEEGAAVERAYTVTWRDISAVVTDAPVVDYTAMPKDALARLLVRHQQVIEKVMATHTIVPLRLGTCADNDEHVRRILASGQETIKDALQKAREVVEIDVTATICDFRDFLRHVSQLPPVVQLRQSFLRRPGGVTVEDQVKIGMIVKQYADREKQRLSQQIGAALAPLAGECRVHDLMDDKMVLNSAFLVRKDRQDDFDRRVETLNAQLENRLDFRCVGPLPPYSFYTLEVRVADRNEMDWARRQLGLCDGSLTAEAIKKAHRKVALACHPDKNPNVPDIEKKFADMNRAYKILLEHYRTSARTQPEAASSGPEPTLEENAIVVATMK